MKSAVYLLPGLLSDEAVWRAQERRLSATHDVRVPRFFGFSSLTDMARAVLAEAPERFALAGHSMGGRVALEIVRLAPGRVERLALLNTGIHGVREGEAERRQVLVDLAYRDGMAALAAALGAADGRAAPRKRCRADGRHHRHGLPRHAG